MSLHIGGHLTHVTECNSPVPIGGVVKLTTSLRGFTRNGATRRRQIGGHMLRRASVWLIM